ncbi:uncharacterized protein FA14DRAFT_8471 [Meira miltonrushii]|uniref:Large ribosomal subunit protein mL54 n=1 Tax=Meira miltonrushii TaxID=1280837 RepID=A0A316VHG4_9BASI|nr:uncharacterized protein FA14DRAFT_8471 [Meira miltonrushii]PWN36986.1 hypothetical protein FA14DRAFT_8471 [Meira miltonrushii]
MIARISTHAARTASRSARSTCQPPAVTVLQSRTFASSSSISNKPSSPQQQQQASTSKGKSAGASETSVSLSSCPEGTTLSGLNIFKDRADPVALPDDQYPNWLWTILEEGKKSATGAILESTEGMTKGEARAAEKRNLRAIRAAHRAKERISSQKANVATEKGSPAGGGLNATGQQAQGITTEAKGSAEALAANAAAIVQDPEVSEMEAKRNLRKANRANIKASNFVKSQ